MYIYTQVKISKDSLTSDEEIYGRYKFNWLILRALKVKTSNPNLKPKDPENSGISWESWQGPRACAKEAPESPWFPSVP